MEQPQVQGVIPYVFCVDAGATADWCVEVLGFRERGRWADDDGAVTNVELAVGSSEVWLDGPVPGWRDGLPQWTGFLVDDVDAVRERIAASGHEVEAPRERSFGVRELTVRDPEGHGWGFVERRP
jgi:uncharacterized glyoxalase superfamily protein PhnB